MSYDPSTLYAGRHNLRCDHCGKVLEAAAVRQPTFLAMPTAATPRRLGHACPACGAVSCEKCRKDGIGWDWWSGYEKARCTQCSAAVHELHVLLPGDGETYRVYDSQAAAVPVAAAAGADTAVSPAAPTVPPVAVTPHRFVRAGNVQACLDLLWWVVGLGGIAALYFFVIAPSQGGPVEFRFKNPALTAAIVAIGIAAISYHLLRIVQRSGQWVEVDPASIRSRDAAIAWDAIETVSFSTRQGKEGDAAFVVRDAQGREVRAGWGLKHIDRLMEVVRTQTRPHQHQRM
ncbi:MAG: hypothetical protein GX591_19950 [Planctomycetes bacterium]|nr:hypothetical protein [Planctomycetota bacterium]